MALSTTAWIVALIIGDGIAVVALCSAAGFTRFGRPSLGVAAAAIRLVATRLVYAMFVVALGLVVGLGDPGMSCVSASALGDGGAMSRRFGSVVRMNIATLTSVLRVLVVCY